jgi:hypothetical protein
VIGFAPRPPLLRGSMPKCLAPAQIEQYREEGWVFPIPIMSETEAAELRGRLEAFERRRGTPGCAPRKRGYSLFGAGLVSYFDDRTNRGTHDP